MNIGWNVETYISIISLILSVLATYFVVKIDWKRYGLLFLISAVSGVALCYVFIYLGLYTFPYRLFPQISKIPFTAILTVFPVYVLLGVRYSPKPWAWKIPFYWVMVHIGMAAEVWAEKRTQLISYGPHWNAWESYTWWCIFLLVFEWVGGMIVTQDIRKPLDQELLHYGKIGWFILHFILITTIFIAGVLLGFSLGK
jgi:hypothetical protein